MLFLGIHSYLLLLILKEIIEAMQNIFWYLIKLCKKVIWLSSIFSNKIRISIALICKEKEAMTTICKCCFHNSEFFLVIKPGHWDEEIIKRPKKRFIWSISNILDWIYKFYNYLLVYWLNSTTFFTSSNSSSAWETEESFYWSNSDHLYSLALGCLSNKQKPRLTCQVWLVQGQPQLVNHYWNQSKPKQTQKIICLLGYIISPFGYTPTKKNLV